MVVNWGDLQVGSRDVVMVVRTDDSTAEWSVAATADKRVE
jgi:hypothetical protein